MIDETKYLRPEFDADVSIKRDAGGRPLGVSFELHPHHPYSEEDISAAATAFCMCLFPDSPPAEPRRMPKKPAAGCTGKLTLDDFRSS